MMAPVNFKILSKQILPVLALLAIGVGTFFWLRDPVVLVVGDYKITKSDVEYRDQVQKVFYPQDPKNYGLMQMERAFTYAMIMKKYGYEISDTALKNEEIRINQNSRDPETLQRIKNIFGSDYNSYLKVFILPTYSERMIFTEVFSKNQNLQSISLNRIREFFDELDRRRIPLSALAKEKKLPFRKMTLSRKTGIRLEEEKKDLPKAPQIIDQSPGKSPPIAVQARLEEQSSEDLTSVQRWIETMMPRLKLGQILQEPVDFGEHWLVLRYVRQIDKDAYQMETVIFPKDSYSDWIEREKSKISVQRF